MIKTSETREQVQDGLSVDKRRKGLFHRLRRRWSTEEKLPTITQTGSTDETEVTAADTDSESFSLPPSPTIYDPSDPLFATYESIPDNTLHSCLNLLSSENLGLNRVGLQRLNLLINGKSILDSYNSKEIAPYVLVLGGQLGSMEELLRFFFVTMICDAPHNTHCYRAARRAERKPQRPSEAEEALEDWVIDYDPSKVIDTDPLDENDDLTTASSRSLQLERILARHSQGKAEGALHNHALRILSNSLGKVYAADRNALADIDLRCSLWRSIITSLVENIEGNHNVNASVYSLKILRILCLVQPTMILPLLKYNLFAVLVDLKDYGEKQKLPILSTEATVLLKHAKGQ